MKLFKKFLAVMLALLLITALTSCSKKVVPLDDYKALVYASANSVGGNDESERYYSGEEFDKIERYTKKSKSGKKSLNLFGKGVSLYYSETAKRSGCSYQMDEYDYVTGGTAIFVTCRADNGKIVEYRSNTAKDPNYSSSVNPDSTEAEFIAYAKQILLDYSGVSTDGWDVNAQAWGKEFGSDSDINSGYTITFSKKIGDLERSDKMYVYMTSVGEVTKFSAINCDETFNRYKDVKVDRAKVEKAVWNAFSYSSGAVSKDIVDIELVTNNDGLWAQAFVEYSLDGITKGGLIYVVKLAELK